MRCGCSHSEARAVASIDAAAAPAISRASATDGMPRRDQRSMRAMMTLETSVSSR